ncbi:MAG: hypothetical protein RPS99_04080, partial [Gammaproteobacteria bacterium]
GLGGLNALYSGLIVSGRTCKFGSPLVICFNPERHIFSAIFASPAFKKAFALSNDAFRAASSLVAILFLGLKCYFTKKIYAFFALLC